MRSALGNMIYSLRLASQNDRLRRARKNRLKASAESLETRALLEGVGGNEPPVITSGANFSVAENTTAITTVTATDAEDGTLVFSMQSGSDSAKFSINPSTGALTFKSAPDFEAPTDADGNNVYVLTVGVEDGFNPVVTKLVSVTVTNVNETPVLSGVGVFSVVENSTAVTTVTATDPDAGTTLTYSIQGGSDSARFSINPSTGALTFQSAPDFETPTDAGVNNVYDLTVGVSDGVNPVVTKNIAVTVTDINEALVESNVFYNKNALAEKNFAPGATGQRSMIRNVEIVFNGNVTIAPESVNNSSFVVTKLGTTTTTNIGLTLVSSSFDSGTLKTTVVLGFATASTLPSGSLSDGNYQLVVNYGVLGIDGNRVGQVGGSKTINFHRLFGDSDGDRDVDGVDNKNYTLGVRGATKWISLFDSDDDGSLLNSLKQDQEDKMAFFANFGRGI